MAGTVSCSLSVQRLAQGAVISAGICKRNRFLGPACLASKPRSNSVPPRIISHLILLQLIRSGLFQEERPRFKAK